MKNLKKEYSSTASSNGLKDLQKQIKDLKSETTGLVDNLGSKLKNTIGRAFTIRGAFAIGRQMVELSKYASDYAEILNLFEVSLGKVTDQYGNLDSVASKYYSKAIAFQNQLEEKLGVNKKETMEYQALFNQMSKSMGIADDYAYKLSENFTKLGLDLSSLFNIDETDAMQKLRAGLAGQTKPLRDLGLDITQQSLQPIADELGLEKSIKQLSQAEKMCLRYIAVLRQTTSAQGDMAKTVESQANQMRIFNNQLYMLKVNVGSFFSGLISSVLPYINGVMMALNAIIKTLGKLFGFEMKASNGVGKVANGIGDLSDGLDDAGKKAKKLKNQLMGWDEIHNITIDTDNDSGSGGIGGSGIDPRILDAMSEYDNLMSQVDMKATSIRDRIMEWLGFTKHVNEETGEVTWSLNDGYTNIEKIGTLIGGLGILGFLGKVATIIKAIAESPLFKLAKELVDTFMKMNGLSLGETFLAIGEAIGLLGAKWIWLKGIWDIVTQSVSPLIQLLEVLGGTVLMVILLIAVGVEAIPALIVGAVMLIIAGITALIVHWEEVKTWIIDFFTKTIPEAWTNFWNWLGEKWADFLKWIKEVPSKIGYWTGYILGLIVKFFVIDIPKKVDEFVKWLFQKWDEFTIWLKSLPEKIKEKINEIKDFLVEFLTVTLPQKWEDFKKWLTELPGKLWEIGKNIVQGLIDGITSMITNINTAIEDFAKGIVQGFKDALGIHSPSKIMEDEVGKNLMDGLKNGITNNPILNTVFSTATSIFNSFKNNLGSSSFWNIGSNIISGIQRGISNSLSSLRSTVTSMAGNVSSWIKNKLDIHSPSRVLRDEVGKFIPLGIAEGITKEASSVYESIDNIKNGILKNAQTIGIETSTMVDYGTINGSISTQTEANINSGFAREIAMAIASELQRNPLEVNIDARTEEGVIVKKASEGFTEYFIQNGELPFPT